VCSLRLYTLAFFSDEEFENIYDLLNKQKKVGGKADRWDEMNVQCLLLDSAESVKQK